MGVKRVVQGLLWATVALCAGVAFVVWALQAFDSTVICGNKVMRPVDTCIQIDSDSGAREIYSYEEQRASKYRVGYLRFGLGGVAIAAGLVLLGGTIRNAADRTKK